MEEEIRKSYNRGKTTSEDTNYSNISNLNYQKKEISEIVKQKNKTTQGNSNLLGKSKL